jgi:single-stranded-DNA-specific exonuclease
LFLSGSMNYQWTLVFQEPAPIKILTSGLGISPLLARCLLNRGFRDVKSAQEFLDPRLKRLSNPFLEPGMSVAVDRIYESMARSEPVLIFGDYDVDGVTSTAILLEVFKALGIPVAHYLPNRQQDGYGLSLETVRRCLESHPTRLLLAVDCGSTETVSIQWLGEQGVDVVVLDHHQISVPPPPALALVNPLAGRLGPDNQGECPCSAGLAFKLAHALMKRGREMGLVAAQKFDLKSLLDLVALGTIADLVPLTGENRIFASAGLKRLNTTTRPGLKALKEVAQLNGSIGVHSVGFQLAPRLNAAGRLGDADVALRLLMCSEAGEASELVALLDASNRDRQDIERGITGEVIKRVQSKFNPETDFAIVEGHENWHVGVVGIVAARVMRQFYRPTIILGGESGEWRGSGRSIDGFDLAAALRACGDVLLRHGGHAMAAGLSIQSDRVDEFRLRLNAFARNCISPEMLRPQLEMDAEVSLTELTLERVGELGALEPVSHGNRGVRLVVRGVRCQRPPMPLGKERKHLKLWVTDGRETRETLWWNARDARVPDGVFDLAFVPEINEFNGRRAVNLRLLDWQPAAQVFNA